MDRGIFEILLVIIGIGLWARGYGDFYISSYDYVVLVFDCVIRLGFYFGYLEFKEKNRFDVPEI